jgi:TolB-like protein/Flp pilus assembly protein TadD
LATARGAIVSKDDLMQQVWHGVVVDENNISVHISALRKALGDDPDGPGYVITVPGRGYRLFGLSAPEQEPSMARPQLPVPDKPSIAVLPLANLGGDPEQEYFAEGISEDIIAALARYRWFFVIARSSSFDYKSGSTEAAQIAGELGVRYILQGSVRRSALRVRIAVQLIDAHAGNHVWADHFDRELTEILTLQDEIAESVAGVIEPELLKFEARRAARKIGGTVNAWDIVRQGTWYFHQLSEPTELRARELFREATRLEPELSEAHAWLARAGASIVAYGWCTDARQELQEAMDAANRAVQLDEKDPYSQYALTTVHIYSGAMERAIRFATKAIDISPSFALGHLALGSAHLFAGNPAAAIDPLEHGLRLNPYDPRNFHWYRVLALAHYFAGHPEAALQAALKALDIRPEWPFTLETAALCYCELGRREEARQMLSEASRLRRPKGDPAGPMTAINPAWAEHLKGVLSNACQ